MGFLVHLILSKWAGPLSRMSWWVGAVENRAVAWDQRHHPHEWATPP